MMDCVMMPCFCKKIRSHHCKVILLDDQELIQEIQDNTRGQEILDIVFRHLNLIETAYFGLRYIDASNQTHWLDPAKKIVKQLKGTNPFSLYFGVKFYSADPCKLVEEITRYQFFLQVKQDILQGRLPVSFDEAAELGAYVVQSELGDFDPRRHSPGYVSEFRFLANQTIELESRIEELHKGLIGQLPAAAELSFLDKVKWLDMYGVDLHPVLGEDNVEYFLGLTPSGIIVLRNKNKVGNYYWPRISKIYFKGRYFMIRISEKNISQSENEENTYGFETPSKPACKHLWKCCVEHHAFFRLIQVSSTTAPDLFALGSKFRYSGRTEKQAEADAQMRLRSPPHFSRTPSRRYQRRIIEGSADVPKIDESNRENIPPSDGKLPTVPLPVNSVYRSTCSIPATLPSHGRSESPRSTRSAPWSQPHVRGLYHSGTSPRSVRSAGNTAHLLHKLTHRSPSVDSQSSNDSRSCKRHRRHRSRRGSDNESEMSKCSSRSHHRHRRRSQSKRDAESDKDNRSHHRHRHKSGSSSRHRHGSQYELVDSEAQWREVQRRQAAGGTGVHQATVINNKDRRSGYMNSGMETESEMSYHHKRKQKKHRSRSRSPSEGGKTRLPDELKKHLEFALIDTAGMSESQLKEIPYTVVETAGKSRKHSPNSKRKSSSNRKSKSQTDEGRKTSVMESPPPPYTASRDEAQSKHSVNHISSGDSGNFSNTGPGSNSSSTSNSALGEFLSKPSNGLAMGSQSSNHSPASSVGRSRITDFKSPSLQNIVGSQYFSSGYNSSPKLKLSTKVNLGQSSSHYGSPSPLLSNPNIYNSSLRSSLTNVSRRTSVDDCLQYNPERQNSYKRTNPPNTLNKALSSDSQYNASLPPLPYVQYDKHRTTRLNMNERSRSCEKTNGNIIPSNRNPPNSFNSERNSQDFNKIDSRKSKDNSLERFDWRRTVNNNTDDSRRRSTSARQQQAPRSSRSINNINGCSLNERFTDHDSIQEDEEPNDENSNCLENPSESTISDDNSMLTPASEEAAPPTSVSNKEDENKNSKIQFKKSARHSKGHFHEMRTEL